MLKKFIGVLLVVFFAMMSSSAQPKELIDDYSVGGSYYFTLTDVESFNDYLYDGTEVNGYVVIATFPIAHLKTEFANEDIPNIAYFLVFKKEEEAYIFVEEYKKCCSGLFYGRDTEYDQYIANNRIVNLLKKINFINPEFTDGDGEYFDAVVTAGVGEYY